MCLPGATGLQVVIKMKIRALIYIPIVFMLLAIQSTILEYLKVCGVKPNLIFIFVISVSLLKGKWEGATVGFLTGLGLDMASGGVLGFHSLLFMYIGLAVGMLCKFVFRENYIIMVLVTFIASLVYGWVIFLLRVFPVAGGVTLAYPFLDIILPEAVYNTVVSVFMHALMIKLNRRLEKAETA